MSHLDHIEFRRVNCQDKKYLEQVIALEESCYGESKFGTLRHLNQLVDPYLGLPGVIIAAIDREDPNDSVVGYCLGLPRADKFFVARNLVHDSWRDMGIGTKLKSRVMEIGLEHSATGVAILAPDNHRNMCINLNKFGWKLVQWQPIKYGDCPKRDHRFYVEGPLKILVDEHWESKLINPYQYESVSLPDFGNGGCPSPNLKSLQRHLQSYVVNISEPAQDFSYIDWDAYHAHHITNIDRAGLRDDSYHLIFSPKVGQ